MAPTHTKSGIATKNPKALNTETTRMEESGRPNAERRLARGAWARPSKRGLCSALGVGLLTASLWFALAAVAGDSELVQVRELPELGGPLEPPLPPTTTFPTQLVLDDNTAESAVGVFGAASRQFLWFNQFAAVGEVEIEEIWIFFPTGQGVSAGDAIQLVIYEDADGDPANGATLLFTLDTTVQVANGIDFSIYPIAPTEVSGDALVGVIPRFIQSGVTPPVSPAALDVNATQSSSYLAFWLGDPPAAPTLPTDDDTVLVDALITGGGNWTIRAFGATVPSEIPVMSPAGLAVLSLLLATAAFLILRQRRPSVGSDHSTWRRR